MKNYKESLKYLTVLPQMRTNYLRYIKSVLLYRLKRIVKFPKAQLKLKGAKFLTRENSMDIPHLSYQYEEETTNLLLSLKPKIFVDVGAHVGRFSIILSMRGSKVISIEPSKENFNQLNKNISLNNLQNKIKAVNVGCSEKEERSTLYFVPHNEGLSSLEKKEGAKKEIIELEKLDNICNNLKVNPKFIDVIKVDVEGFELNVLKGASEILKRGSPLLIVEINQKHQEKHIRDFLKKYNFKQNKILDGRNFLFKKT